jgi:2,4-didehydro-3-deoxy-L-rhamnonate hydrolase
MKMRKITILLFIQIFCAFAIAQSPDHSKIKLFRFGTFENERPAVEYPDGTRLDVSAFGEDFNENFFATNGIVRLQTWLTANVKKCPKVASTERFGSCVARPSKIVAIGLNYAEHIKEGAKPGATAAIPREPVIFLKSTSALCGPFDNAIIPLNAQKMDWEVELAIVIGKKASYVSEADAMNYVAGYTVMNDYSERVWQMEKDGNQWDKGKSSDNFAPLGPYMILAKNLPNPQELNLWLKLNGKTMQNANTRDMIFKLAFLISYTSQHMTLLPGDVISTGTPSGVGNGQKPPLFLKNGDVVELSVENVGTQKQKVVSYVPVK